MDKFRKEQRRFCYWKPKKSTKILGRQIARTRLKEEDKRSLKKENIIMKELQCANCLEVFYIRGVSY